MTRMRERCLVSFIIMAIFGVVQLHFIVLHPRGPQPSPCPRRPGILWVRDPDSCFHYYMCVNGEAIHMPPCPDKMVWSVRASNCVPEKSRWDDCQLKGGMLHPSFLLPLPHPDQFSAKFARGRTSSLDKLPGFNATTTKNLSASSDEQSNSAGKRRTSLQRTSSFLEKVGNTSVTFENEEDFLKNITGNQTESFERLAHFWSEIKPNQTEPLERRAVFFARMRKRNQNAPSAEMPDFSAKMKENRTSSDKRVTVASSAESNKGLEAIGSRINPWHKERNSLKDLYPNHPCLTNDKEYFLPHPRNCHWFYNCSNFLGLLQTPGAVPEGWDVFTSECPYPQLFSDTAFRCQNYSNVDCGKRQLQLDPCDYHDHHCKGAHCQPCHLRHGSCKGMEDGLQPYPGREWTPRHLLCQDQRTMQQIDCPQDSPIFSPDTRKCENLLDVPRSRGGFQPSCVGRHDGRYPAETGSCEVYYECADAKIQGRYRCPRETIFDPERQICRSKLETDFTSLCGDNVTSGIGKLSVSVSLCHGQEDGLYADPFGRCSMYYECKHGLLTEYQRCTFGSFDSRSQKCEFDVTDMAAPCGEEPNPCQDLGDGQYPDLALYCQRFFRCRHNVVTRQKFCPVGTVYHESKGQCQLPDDTPPPCGLAPSCTGKVDGRYPSALKGCGFFFTCHAGVFQGYGRCTVEEGGFYFNPETRSCDFPQNVCPPCGIRTSNCTTEAFS